MRRALLFGSLAAVSLIAFVERSRAVTSAAAAPLQAVLLSSEPDATRFELVAELSGEVHGVTELSARAQLNSVLEHEAEKVEASAVKLDQTRVRADVQSVTVSFRARAFHARSGAETFAQR